MDASWRSSLYTPASWRALQTALHPLFELPHISNMQVEVDELHVMHMGTSAHIAGSVLWMLCNQMLPGTPSANVEQTWSMIVEEYRSLGSHTQFTNFKLGSFCDEKAVATSFPKLKGRGAEIKDIIPPLLAIWRKCEHPDARAYTLVADLLEHQCDLQQILDDASTDAFLSCEAAAEFMEHIEAILKGYSLLANWADERGVLLFSMVPKFHWLWHLGHKAQYLSPRKGNCMVDEDFVGVCKEIVRSCAHGTASHKVPHSFVEKYRWGLHFLNRYGDVFHGED